MNTTLPLLPSGQNQKLTTDTLTLITLTAAPLCQYELKTMATISVLLTRTDLLDLNPSLNPLLFLESIDLNAQTSPV